ncbi:MAG: GNAT family N-acetyltransferase [Paraclostridium sp.]
MKYKVLSYDDYEDIVDISKNIWDGNDYLPKVFHKWVDDKKGCFLGVVIDDKVVAVGKYSVLVDNQGWLEGLRVHIDYRGRQLAHAISDMLFNLSREDLRNGKVTNIGMCTHLGTTASIKMMESKNFILEQSCLIVFKPLSTIDKSIKLSDFKVEKWNISYSEFVNLDYFRHTDNKITYGFTYLNICEKVYNELVESNSLLLINGHPCMIRFKGCPSIICFDNTFKGINDATNYSLVKYKSEEAEVYISNISSELINKLKGSRFESLSDFNNDCLYYVYNE